MDTTYAIWFLPPLEITQQFSRIINKYATEYHAPHFEPHITLLGEIALSKDVVEHAMEKLSKAFSPLTLHLTTIGYEETYHHALFLRVDLTQSLLQMNQSLYTLLALQPKPYMPHMSLLYGHHSNETKEKLSEDLRDLQTQPFQVDTLHLIESSGDESTWRNVLSRPLRGVAN